VALALLCSGPALSTHEVLVAQVARQIIESRDWIVLQYLDAPFLVKPPLPPWLAAGAGLVFPADGATGRQVTQAAARVPSVVATVLTAWIVFCLARSMYGRQGATCAAFVYFTSVGTLVYAFNATAEALLTLFCTWSFAEFWWSRQAAGRQRTLHLMRFYVAAGLAMLAKGPMPLAVLAVPLAAWWFLERITRVTVDGGARRLGHTARFALGDIPTRFVASLRELGLWWGLPLAAAVFMPWMVAVSRRVPHFWQLWSFEYLDRLQSDEMWAKPNNPLYYALPLVTFVMPWALSLPEALASPFLRAYRRQRRGLLFAWYWVVGTTVVLSIMYFKQGYYLLPVIPGCAILLGRVLQRLFLGASAQLAASRARIAARGILCAAVIAGIVGCVMAKRIVEEERFGALSMTVSMLVVATVAGIAFAVRAYLSGRRQWAFVTVGTISLAVFSGAWLTLGPRIGSVETHIELVQKLKEAGVRSDEDVYWTSNIPDGRVSFYGNRMLRQIVDSFKLRAEHRDITKNELMMMVGGQIDRKLAEESPVYMVFTRSRLALFNAVFHPRIYRLFEIDRRPAGPSDDDWVVVSNREPGMPQRQ
jgi:4-amino-4-deoxy-L-arabinose transferase-like glycosyltransferase